MNDDLYEALRDLRHDLAKYIRMPIAWLPTEAGQAEERDALELALRKTRVQSGVATPAREIWERFVGEHKEAFGHYKGSESMVEAVQIALAWDDQLTENAALDRDKILSDFDRVTLTIRNLIEEVADE